MQCVVLRCGVQKVSECRVKGCKGSRGGVWGSWEYNRLKG